MNDQNRVLLRRGARALNEEEVNRISAGLNTETVCTVPTAFCSNKDGDAAIGECGHC
jgi:hypothetical protein